MFGETPGRLRVKENIAMSVILPNKQFIAKVQALVLHLTIIRNCIKPNVRHVTPSLRRMSASDEVEHSTFEYEYRVYAF